MEPRKILKKLSDGPGVHFGSDAYTYEISIRDYMMPGSTREKAQCVIWDGSEFDVVDAEFTSKNSVSFVDDTFPRYIILYHPIDPRMKRKDIQGATIAMPNEDNTGWLFYHCDEDYHHDHEINLEAIITALFQPELDKLLNKTLLDIGISNPANNYRKWIALVKFRDNLIVCARQKAREEYIGKHHQNPTDSHSHDRLTRCIEFTVGFNRYFDTPEYQLVKPSLDAVLERLRDKHDYETRWEIVARHKAEAAKIEAERTAQSESEGE